MKKTITVLLKRLYLVRRLDSLLCAISFVIAAIMVCQEISPGLSEKKWLVIFPVLYLLNEAILLFLYQQIKAMIKKNEIDYFKINRNRRILLEKKIAGKIIVGNLTHFLSFFPNFINLKNLIIFKIIGLSAALLIIMSVLFSNLGITSLIMVVIAGFLIAIKTESDEPEKELT